MPDCPTKWRGLACCAWKALAIREGRATQTRRVIKPQPSTARPPEQKGPGRWWITRPSPEPGKYGIKEVHPPYGIPGDGWYIREPLEAWCVEGMDCVRYKADEALAESKDARPIYWPWIPQTLAGRYMRKDIARTTCVVTAVRPERLRDISEEDAKAEGAYHGLEGKEEWFDENCPSAAGRFYRTGFSELWESLHPRTHGWDENPWVWVYAFEVLSTDHAKVQEMLAGRGE